MFFKKNLYEITYSLGLELRVTFIEARNIAKAVKKFNSQHPFSSIKGIIKVTEEDVYING